MSWPFIVYMKCTWSRHNSITHPTRKKRNFFALSLTCKCRTLSLLNVELLVCFGITLKTVTPCRRVDGHVKEPYKLSMVWEPDCRRRSNFFFSLPAHPCVVTYCGWLYFRGLSKNRTFVASKIHCQSIFLHNSNRKSLFVGARCHGSNPPQKPQKLVPNEN